HCVHCVSTHAVVPNTHAFSGCSHIHLTWTTALDALANQHLLIPLCDSMFHQPTDGAPGRRSCGRIFAAVEKHSSSSFESAFASFRTKKIKEIRPGFLQKLRRLNVTKL